MRIALISFEFPPQTLGGIGTYAQHTVDLLVQRGHDVTVFAGATDNRRAAETCAATVHRLSTEDRTRFHSVAVPALAAEHARRPFDVAEVPDLYAEGLGLRTAAPDLPIVLHAHTPYYIAAQIDFEALPPLRRKFRAARRLLGGLVHAQPWARTWQQTRGRASFAAFYDREQDPEYQAAREATLIAVPSERLARRLRDDWALPSERVRVLPHVHLPAPALLTLPIPTTASTIGFHGNLRHFKGVHVLVDAMPKVLARHPGAQFVLAGASGSSPVPQDTWRAWRDDAMVAWRDTVEWLQPRLATLGDRVRLSGFVPPERLAEHLAACDVCVFPSLFDNFPSACLEAMSAGRAIVASRSGGMEDMLAPTQAGLLVPSGDAAALAEAMIRLIENPGLAATLGGAARTRVLAEYSPARIGPLTEALYAEAMELWRGAASIR